MKKLYVRGFVFIILGVLASCAMGEKNPNYWLRLTPEMTFDDKDVVALTYAARKGDVNKIDELVKAGVNVNKQGKLKLTPLFFALGVENKEGVKALLEHGADTNVIYDSNDAPIHLAITKINDPWFLKTILEHGGNANLPRGTRKLFGDSWSIEKLNKGWTEGFAEGVEDGFAGFYPMHFAVGFGSKAEQVEKIKLLLLKGADINSKTPNGYTPVMDPAMTGDYDIEYFLLENGADCHIKAKHKNGEEFTLAWNMNRRNLASNNNMDSAHLEWREKVISWLKDNCHEEWEKLNIPKDDLQKNK